MTTIEAPTTSGILTGDCRDALAAVESHTIAAVVCDPPYDLTGNSRNGSPRINDPATPYGRTRTGERGFMGATWDGTGVAFDPNTWSEIKRVTQPGAPIVAFSSSRTWHRMAAAMDHANLHIVGVSAYLYGSGFPKSMDIPKAITKAGGENPHHWVGYGTALKPAWEPIVVAWHPKPGVTPPPVPGEWYGPKASGVERVNVNGIEHPTVKPLALIDHLIAEIGPTGTVLDPFLGSGTTAEVCEVRGHNWIGVELCDGTNNTPNYVALIEQRLARAQAGLSPLDPHYETNLAAQQARDAAEAAGQYGLFE